MGASSRAFTLIDPPNVINIDCATTGKFEKLKGEVGSKFTVNCPSFCSFEE
jgi:hypothetical protein